jgi:mono/diheme cytochrome c family protein
MNSPASLNIAISTLRRRTLLLGLVGLLTVLGMACSVQETNAYPVDLFTEMHYAQSNRSQEPPRLQPPAQSISHESAGSPDVSLAVPEFRRRGYDPVVGAQLFAVNCSVCHGLRGEGNGPAAAHLNSDQSFWATQDNRGPYGNPANLFATRSERTEDIWFTIVNNGVTVMPPFGKLLSEEDIWEIISYLFDEQTGLGTAQ